MFTAKQLPSMIARRQARLRGECYFTGTPCRHGHTLRYTSCGTCVDCAKLRSTVQYYVDKIAST